MMLFWLICAAVTLVTVALLLWPLLRARAAGRDEDEPRGLAVYRDQLQEVERDRARGLLDEEQAAAARLEVERRLLAITETEAARPAGSGIGSARALAVAVGLLVPLVTLGLYVGLGSPGLPGEPFVERQGVAPPRDIAEMAESLANRLARGGGSAEDWSLLARTYAQLDRMGPAAEAAGQAIRLGMDDAETHSFRGEMLTAAAGGTVTEAARQAFAQALERDPGNPRALYYAGLALAQDDQLEPALEIWTTLAEASSPDAPWLHLLRQQIRRVAGDLGVEPPAIAGDLGVEPPAIAAMDAPALPPAGSTAPGQTAPGPTAEDVAAAQDMSDEDRMAFIRSMVERLAERLEGSPEDLDGWLRLSRAYLVLQEPDKASAALARAEALVEPLPADAPERGAVAAARRALEAGG